MQGKKKSSVSFIAVIAVSAVIGITVAIGANDARAAAPASEADAARADIKAAFGFVPGFMAAFPDEGIAGAWDEFKSIQANPKSAIPNKYKELIGLGVAAQIPCDYCVYFHTQAAKANGATDREIKEAVAVAAIVRHWSTWLNGSQQDEATFRKDLAQIVTNVKSGKPPAPVNVVDAASAREDIKRTFGFVPTFMTSFPELGVAGAWREIKSVQMNPNTAIPTKYKEMIGLAVAAQMPCHYCTAFHTTMLKDLNGASPAEIQEAIAMAAIVRHWSTFLNGVQIDRVAFKAEVDRALKKN
jgi:AhpD family alkylhydroperoxidase